MEFFREVGELRGNQGMEEEEGVMSVEPIAMIVLSELQDFSETLTPESSASSSAHEGSGVNCSSSSEGSSSEKTPSDGEDVGEGVSSPSPESVEVNVNVPMVVGCENKIISGRLSNLRKAPHTLAAGFRFRANLHHEIADCATSIKGYKRLEEIVRQYHVPRTILLRTGTKNEKTYTVLPTGWIPVYVDHFDASLRFPLPRLIFDVLAEYELALTQLTPNSIKFIIGFMLLCARLEILAKAIVFRSLFLCQLSITQMRITNYVKTVGLVDLEALVTPEVLAVCGFVDVTNLFSEEMSSMLERQHEWAQRSRTQRSRAQCSRARGAGSSMQRQTHFDERPPAAPRSSSQRERGFSSASRPHAERRVEAVSVETRRRAREDSDAKDDVPLIRCRLNSRSQSGAVRSPDAPAAQARNTAEALPTPAASGMQNFVPLVDRQRAKGYIQQHGSHAAMLKLMDALNYSMALFESEQAARGQNCELTNTCKQLTSDKASLEDKAEKESGIQAAMDEVVRAVDRAKKAEAERDNALNDLNTLRQRVAVADQDLARAEEGLRKAKTQH
ncbi:hypothetical protein SLEP1_g54278 [Rubroshorea leprosula]|uniref:Transposase (putative) gypsy type domain-containing protein n=1 Tax=Rubroshorea leprosula TaxID=152421 RepID=A0AAV5MET6_9ROSI|nr:hypothetical protein SLEP1_g54278 [Rubroshorea leprosula]